MDMNDFISTIRTDRQREIRQKEKKEFLLGKLSSYRYVSEVETVVNEKKVNLGVQANQKDLFFYVITHNGNSYYTIVDLYEIFLKIVINGNEGIVMDTLNKMLEMECDIDYDDDENNKDAGKFVYKDVTYCMKPFVIPEYKGVIEMEDGGDTLTYENLFILLNFIQEKSNALFTRSKGKIKYEGYTDGLLRLFIALLSSKENHEELSIRGWTYDENLEKFVHKPVDKSDKELNAKKYYLTKEELSNIIKTES